MEDKMNKLRLSIKENPNLSDAFKCNLGTLTDTMVTVLGDYDYSYFEQFLRTLKISNNEKNISEVWYDKKNNELKLNLNKIFENGVDLQHLFLQKMLSIGTHKEEKDDEAKGFYDGMSEAIALLMNADEGTKKLNPLEHLCIMQLSNIADPNAMIDSYMKDDLSILLDDLEEKEITKDEFIYLIKDISQISDIRIPENDAFATSQKRMIYMFGKKVKTDIIRGKIDSSMINEQYDAFNETLVHNPAELRSMFSHYTFVNMGDLKWVSKHIKFSKDRITKELNEEVLIPQK